MTMAFRLESAERERLETLRRARGFRNMSELLTSMVRDLLAASDRGAEAQTACKRPEVRVVHGKTCPVLSSLPVGRCARCGAIIRLADETQEGQL
jgi:hypothetical protein